MEIEKEKGSSQRETSEISDMGSTQNNALCFIHSNSLIFTHLLLFSEVCVEFGLRHNFTRMQGKQIREAILKIKS